MTLSNTIVAGNTATDSGPDVRGDFTSAGFNLIGIGDGADGFTNGVNGDQVGSAASPIDPRLGPLQDNGGPTFTHALLFDSPALDAGDPNLAGTTDQRGILRPLGGVDIGAFELTAVDHAAALQSQVDALHAAGVLNDGQATALRVKLALRGKSEDAGNVQGFIHQVTAWVHAGILSPEQAEELLVPARRLLASLTRR